MPGKTNRMMKRITAGAAAFLLAVTGCSEQMPGIAYAMETTWPASDSETANSQAETTGIEEFNAALGGVKKYFMKLGARAFNLEAVTPGESLAAAYTSVSFAATDGYYYLVRLSQEGEPQLPGMVSQALDDGWVRKVGTGTYVWQNLSWNRTYQVYELNFSESPASMRLLGSAETKKGMTGGTVTITGDILTGNQITAKLENPTTEDGSFLWYSAASAGAAASDWTLLSEGVQGASLTIPDSIRGLYVKAVFTATAGGDFEGSIEAVTSVPAATSLNRAVIAGRAEIGQKLTASTDPEACGPGMRYEWYRAAGETMDALQDQMVYTGNPYEIQPEDIGKRLYVKAVSLPTSVSVGDKISDLTEPVIAVPYGAPSAPQVTGSGAESLTVRMPDGSEGLYELGYSVNGSDFTLVQTKVRGTNSTVIPGLASSTVYYIWARQCGEHGFTDSAWSSMPVTGKTLPPPPSPAAWNLPAAASMGKL